MNADLLKVVVRSCPYVAFYKMFNLYNGLERDLNLLN